MKVYVVEYESPGSRRSATEGIAQAVFSSLEAASDFIQDNESAALESESDGHDVTFWPMGEDDERCDDTQYRILEFTLDAGNDETPTDLEHPMVPGYLTDPGREPKADDLSWES